MQKVQPKIVFFDIDDTLYIKDEKRIADSTRHALKALNAKGIITAIATGRSPGAIPARIKELIQDTGIGMIVSINGQLVMYCGKVLHETPMATEEVAQVADYLNAHGIAYGSVGSDILTVSHQTPELHAATGDLGLGFEVGPKAYETHAVYQMMAFYNDETGRTIEPGLPDTVKPIRWHESGVDLLVHAGSKARGIQAALDKLGLDMADAMAFGDGLNDIEMLQAVGCGVAMGNGQSALKAVADHICPPVTEDGVYRGLVELGVLEEMPV